MDPSLSPVTILSTHTHYHLCLCVCVCLPFSTKVSHWQRKFRKSDHITIIIKKRTLYDLELVSLPLSFLIGKNIPPWHYWSFQSYSAPPPSPATPSLPAFLLRKYIRSRNPVRSAWARAQPQYALQQACVRASCQVKITTDQAFLGLWAWFCLVGLIPYPHLNPPQRAQSDTDVSDGDRDELTASHTTMMGQTVGIPSVEWNQLQNHILVADNWDCDHCPELTQKSS